MGSSLFEQNLSGSAFRRGLPLPREIRLTGIILSSSLSLFLSRWVKNRPVNCHNRLTSAEDHEEASLLGCPPIGLGTGRMITQNCAFYPRSEDRAFRVCTASSFPRTTFRLVFRIGIGGASLG